MQTLPALLLLLLSFLLFAYVVAVAVVVAGRLRRLNFSAASTDCESSAKFFDAAQSVANIVADVDAVVVVAAGKIASNCY